MARRKKPAARSKSNSNGPGESSARATMGGPAGTGGPRKDPRAARVASIESLAGSMRYNRNKALEHGAAADPPSI